MSGAVSAGAPPSATPEMLGLPVAAWLQRAHEVIAASADALNQLNVFPISDSDTGTNVQLTLRGILDASPASGPVGVGRTDPGGRLVRPRQLGGDPGRDGHQRRSPVRSERLRRARAELRLAQLLRAAAAAATRAVARPVAGTVLTVADDAAGAAEQAADEHPDDVRAVLDAARAGRRPTAWPARPSCSTVLAQAGVVDAGGQAYVLLLDVLGRAARR